jgi:hypothetical protein
LENWEVRAGFLYTVAETKLMAIHLRDTDGKKHTLKT